MSVAAIRFEVVRCLAQAKEHVHDAEVQLASGSDDQKIKAAGQLEFYKHQQAALEARIAQLDRCPENPMENLIQGIKKEWLVQKQMFEEWSHGARL
ncbi:MAG: hypothetical protein H0X27_10095 [Caulobacteraceae bacterium]|nr:hypothetical protein [Caulobacteraceae bacterium]